MDKLFACALPFIEERGDQIVFGGVPEATWGESEEYGPARPVEGSEFVIDRRYWEMIGKPDKLSIGFANEDGWEKWVGAKPENLLVHMWLQADEVVA